MRVFVAKTRYKKGKLYCHYYTGHRPISRHNRGKTATDDSISCRQIKNERKDKMGCGHKLTALRFLLLFHKTKAEY